MYNRWRERLQNLLDVQKNLKLETIRAEFTRMDLIELRVMVQSLIDLNDMDEIEKSQNYCAVCPIKRLNENKIDKYETRDFVIFRKEAGHESK